MCVYTHVACRPTQTLPFTVRNVLSGLGIAVLLRHAKIDDVDEISILGPGTANEEVVRLDVAIDQVLLVDRLHTRELHIIHRQALSTTR